jgi:hypothetical protein
MRGFFKRQFVTLRAKAPPGDRWIHEIESTATAARSTSIAAACRCSRDRVSTGRKNLPSSPWRPPLPVDRLVIDGEICVVETARPISPRFRPS